MHWWALRLRGIFGVVAGLVLIFASGRVLSFGALFALYAAMDGVLMMSVAMGSLLAPAGLAGLTTAFVVATHPWRPTVTFAMVITAWCIVAGVLQAGAAVRRRWLAAGAIGSLLFGIMMLVVPLGGALSLALYMGCYACLTGVMHLLTASRLRRSL